ncbi:aldehyde dehydrogenase [Candidatus Peregrinibacteria bacterium]|nr:aldehyde dehydrogenase [Candidatus Peregrinibacteria bacterium]
MPKIISTNPSQNYAIIGEVEISADNEVAAKVQSANAAKLMWKELGVEKRIEMLRPLYEKFAAKKEEFALLITKEMGKPISQSTSEMQGALEEIKWFLDNGAAALKNEITHEDAESIHQIVYEPFGTAAVITPWNFPFAMFVWGTFPNLIAGNTVVFKITEECPLTGKLIEAVMNSADLPLGVFSEVYGAGDIGHKLATSDVNLIWFTGSTKVGKELYKIAADKFIKALLEMGGSSPAIVFEDADLDKAVAQLYEERFNNCGQVCDAIKRLIVHESIYAEVTGKLIAELKTKKIGNPQEQDTDISSLVAKRQQDLLASQVQDAIDKGAKVEFVKEIPQELQGAYYPPTILTDIKTDMRVWKEEVFGPVLPIVTFKTEEEAVRLANDTCYGLGSRIYTKDTEKAKRIASKIEAGTVEINNVSRWHSKNPFGGYKSSGMGRELGTVGFRELCQIKVMSAEI